MITNIKINNCNGKIGGRSSLVGHVSTASATEVTMESTGIYIKNIIQKDTKIVIIMSNGTQYSFEVGNIITDIVTTKDKDDNLIVTFYESYGKPHSFVIPKMEISEKDIELIEQQIIEEITVLINQEENRATTAETALDNKFTNACNSISKALNTTAADIRKEFHDDDTIINQNISLMNNELQQNIQNVNDSLNNRIDEVEAEIPDPYDDSAILALHADNDAGGKQKVAEEIAQSITELDLPNTYEAKGSYEARVSALENNKANLDSPAFTTTATLDGKQIATTDIVDGYALESDIPDVSNFATKEEIPDINGKQNKLTSGDGIDINNDVISTTLFKPINFNYGDVTIEDILNDDVTYPSGGTFDAIEWIDIDEDETPESGWNWGFDGLFHVRRYTYNNNSFVEIRSYHYGTVHSFIKRSDSYELLGLSCIDDFGGYEALLWGMYPSYGTDGQILERKRIDPSKRSVGARWVDLDTKVNPLIDTKLTPIQAEIENKQDKLTAGENIEIIDNTINSKIHAYSEDDYTIEEFSVLSEPVTIHVSAEDWEGYTTVNIDTEKLLATDHMIREGSVVLNGVETALIHSAVLMESYYNRDDLGDGGFSLDFETLPDGTVELWYYPDEIETDFDLTVSDFILKVMQYPEKYEHSLTSVINEEGQVTLYGHGYSLGVDCEVKYAGSVAEGAFTKAIGASAHAEGNHTEASGPMSHSEGAYTKAIGYGAHAEGTNTKAYAWWSHAEGVMTEAIGYESHTEGEGSIASGVASHAEGYKTKAAGQTSHAEGYTTEATGNWSHAEGVNTKVTGTRSHGEGQNGTVSGNFAHGEGLGTIANGNHQHVQGRYNIADTTSAHIVGNGSSDTKRSNAHTLDFDGNAWYAGNVTVGADKKKLINEDELNTALTNKQDKLTPGNNITIIDNVISATGGEGSSIDVQVDGTSIVQDGVANIQLQPITKDITNIKNDYVSKSTTTTQTLNSQLFIGSHTTNIGNAFTHVRKLASVPDEKGRTVYGLAFAVGLQGYPEIQYKTYDDNGGGGRNEAVLRMTKQGMTYGVNSGSGKLPAETDYKDVAIAQDFSLDKDGNDVILKYKGVEISRITL